MLSSRQRLDNGGSSRSPIRLKGRQEGTVSKSSLVVSNVFLLVLLVGSLLLEKTPKGCSQQALATMLKKQSTAIICENTTKLVTGTVTEKAPPSLTEEKCIVKFRDEKMAFCNFVNIANGGNFGDELGPVVSSQLVENLFGCSAKKLKTLNLKTDEEVRKNEGIVCLFSLGSVFHKVRSGDYIWGTGINPTWQSQYPKPLTIYAVRGKLTEELVRNRLKYTKPLALGDPGFAIPTLFPELLEMRKASKAKTKGNRFCFVPHAHDTTSAKAQLDKSIRIITVYQRWRPVVETLAKECDYVASTSLHGIIESDALGIPTLWFQWFNSTVSHTEGQFKYLDYFSTVNKTIAPISDLSQVLNKSAYAAPLKKSVGEELVKDMQASFPYHLFDTVR